MRIINRRLLADTAYEQFSKIHKVQQEGILIPWLKQYHETKSYIAYQLKELGEHPNPDDVDKIIGDNSWTKVPRCSNCGQDREEVVELKNQDADPEDIYHLCMECVREILMLIDS